LLTEGKLLTPAEFASKSTARMDTSDNTSQMPTTSANNNGLPTDPRQRRKN